MDWQEPVALVIVAVAAAGLALRQYRARQRRFHQDSPCGCTAGRASEGAQSSIVFKARKGCQPVILVKHR